LLSADFWLHLAVMYCISGAAYFLINNLAQVVRATEPADEAAANSASLVSLLSACNCLGRLGGASASEYAARAGLPRTAPFVAATVLMALAMYCVALHSRNALLPACALAGLSFGALNALNAVVVAPLYGMKAFGAIYSTIALAGALSSASLASGLAVIVYERNTAVGALVCEGPRCFRETALVCAALNVLGCAFATLLSVRVHRRR